MAQGSGTLFGLIHDIGDRRRAAKTRDAMRNFLVAPTESITAVNEVDPLEAIKLRDYEASRQAGITTAANAAQDRQSGLATKDAERYRTAALGITAALRGTRDKGGDLGVEIDNLVPVLTRGFQMKPEEILDLKTRITANPALLDNMQALFADPKDNKPLIISSGANLVSPTGNVLHSNPAAVRPIQMKRGDGGSDLYVVDENGNLVQSGSVAGAPGPASVPGTGGAYSGPLNINPQARGVRNGNPGNIKDGPWARKQPGYIGNDGTFAKFAPGMGEKAQENLLANHYVNGQRSTTDIVMKYLGGAGNKENSNASQRNYVAYVAGRLGIDPSAPVPPARTAEIAQAMREFENGTRGPVSRGAGPVASTAGKPEKAEGWRDLTPDEVKQRGLDATKAYQVGLGGANTGKVVAVSGQGRTPAAGKAGKPSGVTLQAHTTAVADLQKARDEARAIAGHPSFNQATGSIQGRMPSLFQGSQDFDTKLQSYRDRTVINALKSMKAASPNGASGFGSLQLKEGERLENYGGALSQTSPANLRATLQTQANDAMVSIGLLYNIRPEATQLLIRQPTAQNRAYFDRTFGPGMARRILGN